MVYLEGKLTHRKWEDKEGNPRRTTEVVGNYFRILNRRELAENGGYSGGGNNMAGNTNAPSPVEATTVNNAPPVDDDLPF